MRFVHLFARLHRGAAFAVLGVALTTLALSLSQCRTVDERLTGVTLSSAKPGQCVANCGKAFLAAKKLEINRHKTLVAVCAGDTVCLALENIRFEQSLELLKADHRACLATCHHQGSGDGGR
jgi:hypothetical protein